VSPCIDQVCKAVNKTAFTDGTYPLTRRIFVVIKQDGKLDEQAGVAYANMLLSDEGQKLVEEAGFVPIR
jgi:phosphate transport system substrate-binding protein